MYLLVYFPTFCLLILYSINKFTCIHFYKLLCSPLIQNIKRINIQANKRKQSALLEDSPSKKVKVEEENPINNPRVFTEEALANLKIYNELKTVYEEEGVNQQTHQFLNRISQRKISENDNLSKVPLMQLLSNACKVMMLSEFEIAAWACWLDKLKLMDFSEYSPEDYILFTAFYIKMSLNDEEYLNGMFQSFFNCYIRGFIVKFNRWLKGNK